MREIPIAFIGFGNVGKALAELFELKKAELEEKYHVKVRITGVYTYRHGTAVKQSGLITSQLLTENEFSHLSETKVRDPDQFIVTSNAEVLFENSPVNYQDGQPALDYIHSGLSKGKHVITANKGPVVHGYRELSEIARQKNVKFYFESTVMDGAPIFSLFRESLFGANLIGFRGILNSTTNMILKQMEEGASFDEAVAYCQKIGIAETDPSGDIDGWDAAVKVAALCTVLMDTPIKPVEIDREGIRKIDANTIGKAREKGFRWKLICSAIKTPEGVMTKVAPEMVGSDSPFYGVNGTSSMVQFETDVLGLLSIIEANPGPRTTAYGLFADFLQTLRPR